MKGPQPKPKHKTSPKEPAPKKQPSFQGRASAEQTERAMSRLQSSHRSRSKNKWFARESDEETEDEDAERDRARTAHLLFAQSQDTDPFGFGDADADAGKSDSLTTGESPGGASASAKEKEKTDERSVLDTPTPTRTRNALPTPSSRGVTQAHRPLPSLDIAGGLELGKRQREETGLETPPSTRPPVPPEDTPRTPKRKAPSPHSSPLEPSTKKQKLAEVPTIPTIDLTTKSKYFSSPRMKTNSSPKENCVPQVTASTIASSSTSTIDNDKLLTTTRRKLTESEKEAHRLERKRITERLSLVLPHSVKSASLLAMTSSRKITRNNSVTATGDKIKGKQRASTDFAPTSSMVMVSESDLNLNLVRRSSEASSMHDHDDEGCSEYVPVRVCDVEFFIQDEGDREFDWDKMRAMAEMYRAEMAKGIRPGLVIPRMACLDGLY